jgi:hypothetical protein
MTTFAHWQPRYADAGIPIFPVKNKQPLVQNYTKMGLPAADKLKDRFAEADAFGFACGPSSGITVLDFDTTDERVIEEILTITGPTPVLVQTHSGKLHAWYRHSGERRMTRIDGRPIDILGRGLAVAPPSRGAKGTYRFIRGSLADVESLPAMKPLLPTILSSRVTGSRSRELLAAEDVTPEGQRNDALFRHCLQNARANSKENLLAMAQEFSQTQLQPPLPQSEVIKTAESALRMEAEGRNWCGAGQRLFIPFDVVDDLLRDAPDAFILLTLLRRRHFGLRNVFFVANAMARSMPGKPWSRLKFSAARAALERRKHIELVRRPSIRTGAALYRFPS